MFFRGEKNMEKNDVLANVLRDAIPIGQEYVEIGLDSLIALETLKQIPIVNTITGVLKLSRTISDTIFLKKLINFIYNLQDVEVVERERFITRYTKDEKNFSEKLICIIDKLDDIDKSKYLANIFKCYGRGIIDYSQFRRYCRAIDVLNIDEILYFNDHINDKALPTIYGISLFNAGLGTIINTFGGNDYKISKEGIKFLECVFR